MFAYVTLVTNADYRLGALALARSLQAVGSRWPLVVLATEAAGSLAELESEGCQVERVSRPAFTDEFQRRHERGELHARAPYTKGNKPAFHDPLDNFCKLSVWQLTQY